MTGPEVETPRKGRPSVMRTLTRPPRRVNLNNLKTMSTATYLTNTTSLLNRITNATGEQFLAQGFDLTLLSHDPECPQMRLWVDFWSAEERDLGLDLLLSALSADGYEVLTQASNLLRVSEIELVIQPS